MNVRAISWNHPHIELRSSHIHGLGAFANAPLRAGETLFIWGGLLADWDDFTSGRITSRSCMALKEGLYLGKLPAFGDFADDYANHSCDPNAWLIDSVTVVARRDIALNEEVTIDYATFYELDDWIVTEDCHCGAACCRKRVTGADWQLPELQERYAGHFSPLLEERIRLLSDPKPAS